MDEDIDIALEQALINRGVDVVSTLKAEKIGNTDEEQLSFAKNEKRIVITHNVRDFVILHQKVLKDDGTHCGIIVSDQLPIGTLLKRVMNLWFSLDTKEMESRIEFLSNWT